ncbi:MAG TPA: response regulator transcription factor [Saprospiraceae bacterium]|nr:response regulator transcription factor [Saprospiraceae bacterium]HND87147.1 response regulator transcription factor [Saprospiraceae bacterium]HNG89686.1 response regulator transcription factor [Saprospiraceae bacterium]
MNKIKVLYVEDEPALARIVSETLESRHFEVRWYADGVAALEGLNTFRPDICVLDVMLPKLDGFAVGKIISTRLPELPLLYLTAKSQTADVLQGFESGGNDYVRKPFSMEELIVRLHNLLNLRPKSASMPVGELQIGQFIFAPRRQELAHAERVQRLSYRETQVLELLCAQVGEVVSRKHLLDQVWGNDSFFNSRNLDVYITKLREYLLADPQVQIITLRGVGYRLVPGGGG